MRLGLIADVGVDVGEDAARDEVPLFVEVVIARAGGELEIAEPVAAFAKQRFLLDDVWQVGVVRTVCREAIAQGGDRHTSRWRSNDVQECLAERIGSRRRQALRIFAVNVAVESAEHPLEWALGRRRETKLLRPLLELGRVAEVRVQPSAADCRGRRAREGDVDRAGQRRRIAADEDVAIHVACHRRQLGRAEVVTCDEIGQERLVAELLLELQILLTFAEVTSCGAAGELIIEEDVMVLSIEPVGLNLLINDARRDLELGGRLEEQRDAPADTLPVVDVLLAERSD